MSVYINIFEASLESDADSFKLKDRESLKAAIKHMKLWQLRAETRLPIAVESTLILLETLLVECSPVVSQHQTQMIYAMAITRFVNGLVDQQQKGAYSVPVAQLARNMDIPRFLVDIRHAATHDSLPSIHVLRKAVNTALSWLYNNYWAIQLGYTVEIKSVLVDLLKRYKWNRKQSLKTVQDGVNVPLTEDQMQMVKEIVDLIPEQLCKETFCEILISNEGLLVPLARKKRCTLEHGVSETLLELWFPLLQALSYSWRNLFMDLFDTSLAFLCGRKYSEDATYHTTIAVWMRVFIQEICNGSSMAIKKSLLDSIVKSPNEYSKYLIESDLFSDLKDDRVCMLSEFARSFSSSIVDRTAAHEDTTDPLSDMKKRLELLSSNKINTVVSAIPTPVTLKWRTDEHTAEYWSNIPIGGRI